MKQYVQGRARNHRVQVSLHEWEKDELLILSKKYDMTLSETLRYLIILAYEKE